MGLPWKDKGRGPDGYDCWGLVIIAYKAFFDIELPLYEGAPDPAELAETHRLIQTAKSFWVPVTGTHRFGDLVLFKILGQEVHIGFVTRPWIMLHMWKDHASCQEAYDIRLWKPALVGAYRHPDLCES